MNLNGPALAPPPGVTPDFESPPNNNPLAIGVISACTAVSTICLLLRAYARVWLQRRVQIEEGVHCPATCALERVSLTVYSSVDPLRIRMLLGSHVRRDTAYRHAWLFRPPVECPVEGYDSHDLRESMLRAPYTNKPEKRWS